jgi:hypothetical protein
MGGNEMDKDLIIDTNVLVHANNRLEPRRNYSVNLISHLITSDILLGLDPGFSLMRESNKSLIGAEYHKHLIYGTLGYALLVEVFKNKRIKEIDQTLDRASTKKILQHIRNKRDRTFLKVTINSSKKTLVSHDFQDFSVSNRRYFKREFDIKIIEASQFLKDDYK